MSNDTSREALIADLRLNHEYCPKEVMIQAADMLEADARELEATERQVEILSDELSKCSKQAQAAEPVLFIDADTLAMAAAHVGAWKPGHELEGNLPLYLHPAAPAQQVAAPVPDMFWNHDDAETLYSSISEFLNDEMCDGTELAVGDIRTVQRAVRLPNIDIRITSVNDDECDADYEIVEAQGAKT